jgi:hypothetical protein
MAVHSDHHPAYLYPPALDGALIQTIRGLRGSHDCLPYHAVCTHLVTTGGLECLRLHSAGSTLSRLWPTSSSLRWLSLITAWYFSSSPSDSASRRTPCPLGYPSPRGITPEFGYESPNPRLSGTLTHLTVMLPRTQCGLIRHPLACQPTSSFNL